MSIAAVINIRTRARVNSFPSSYKKGSPIPDRSPAPIQMPEPKALLSVGNYSKVAIKRILKRILNSPLVTIFTTYCDGVLNLNTIRKKKQRAIYKLIAIIPFFLEKYFKKTFERRHARNSVDPMRTTLMYSSDCTCSKKTKWSI
jgi:hypothetical protein